MQTQCQKKNKKKINKKKNQNINDIFNIYTKNFIKEEKRCPDIKVMVRLVKAETTETY